MQHKFLLILPISIIGLLSCMPDSTPKKLSYEDTLSYINKNYKEFTNVSTGYVEYTCEDPLVSEGILKYLGAEDPIEKSGKNQISNDNVNLYISKSVSPLDDYALPLMYLNPNNFPTFISATKAATYSYQLTYVKELIMSSTIDGNVTYTRYYNTSLHLTRFEVISNDTSNIYTATQTSVY